MDDEGDEIIDPRMLMNPEAEYKHDIGHLKARYKDLVGVYASPEFRLLRDRLKRIVGEIDANRIMNDNI